MYEQQEEYLVVVKYDVKLFLDLVHLKFRLQRVDEELCKVKKKCIERGLLGKGSAKLRKNLKLFEASADGYRERLEQIKLQKKDNLKKMKAVEQCLERDGSTQCFGYKVTLQSFWQITMRRKKLKDIILYQFEGF